MNKELEKVIISAGDLPTIPMVATRIMRLVLEEHTTADELARIIASDPAVAARVLKISNSSFYGCQSQIQTLPHAIMMLGFVTLKSVVVTASAKQVYNPFGLIEKLLWEHSFGAGIAARIIAAETGIVNPDEAFLGGLFHDLGKQIMNFTDKNRFQELIQRCYNEEISFATAESQLFAYSHDEAGALVVRKWNFPENLVKAVMYHHKPEFDADEDPYVLCLANVVSLANLFCHRLGIGTIHSKKELDLANSSSVIMLGLSGEQLEGMLDQFGLVFEEDRKLFI